MKINLNFEKHETQQSQCTMPKIISALLCAHFILLRYLCEFTELQREREKNTIFVIQDLIFFLYDFCFCD